MTIEAKQAPLGFSEDVLPVGTHMCLIYNDDEERRVSVGRFLEAGLQEGEKVAYFADIMSPAEVRTWLSEMDIALPEDEQLAITNAEETYCPEGEFKPRNMLDTLRAFHGACHDAGYPAGRVSGEMSWALRGIPGSDRLMEYEALVNDVLVTHPITAICQYDVRRFDGAMIFDVLKVHPMMVVHGRVVKNPYYMKPQDFMSSQQ